MIWKLPAGTKGLPNQTEPLGNEAIARKSWSSDLLRGLEMLAGTLNW